MNKFLKILTFASLLVTTKSFGFNGIAGGAVGQIEVAATANTSFRVRLVGQTNTYCNGAADSSFVFVSSSSPQYSSFVATVLLVKATGAQVTLLSDVSADGQNCELRDLLVN